MKKKTISLAGFEWNFTGDAKAIKNVWASDFYSMPPFTPGKIEVSMISEKISPPSRKLKIDTGLTWQLSEIEDEEFLYLLSPSPRVGFDPNSLHLFASKDFRKMKMHLGKWKQLPESPWIFNPYEQTIMIHLGQFTGDSALMHASAVYHNGKGYLFLGDSGAGKSSIAELCEEKFGKDKIFSDDRVVVRLVDGKWWVFGTPWNGTFPRSRPDGVEIGGMFFLEKSEKNHLVKPKSPTQRIMPVTFGTWWMPEKMENYFSFVEKLCQQTQFPLEEFHFRKDLSAVNYLSETW
jgi:hypothetical protein